MSGGNDIYRLQKTKYVNQDKIADLSMVCNTV